MVNVMLYSGFLREPRSLFVKSHNFPTVGPCWRCPLNVFFSCRRLLNNPPPVPPLIFHVFTCLALRGHSVGSGRVFGKQCGRLNRLTGWASLLRKGYSRLSVPLAHLFRVPAPAGLCAPRIEHKRARSCGASTVALAMPQGIPLRVSSGPLGHGKATKPHTQKLRTSPHLTITLSAPNLLNRPICPKPQNTKQDLHG